MGVGGGWGADGGWGVGRGDNINVAIYNQDK